MHQFSLVAEMRGMAYAEVFTRWTEVVDEMAARPMDFAENERVAREIMDQWRDRKSIELLFPSAFASPEAGGRFLDAAEGKAQSRGGLRFWRKSKRSAREVVDGLFDLLLGWAVVFHAVQVATDAVFFQALREELLSWAEACALSANNE